MKIIEIGEAVGYENDKHFLKVFKGAYSVTPSEYRKNIKNGRMIVTSVSYTHLDVYKSQI